MRTLRKGIGVVAFTLIAVLMVLPLTYMLLLSFTSSYSTVLSMDFSKYNLNNYQRIFTALDFTRYFFNTLTVVVGAVMLNNILGAMAGFAFAKKKFPAKSKLYYGIIATMMIPGQVTLIPMYTMASAVKLNNTYLILMLPVISAFTVFFMTQTMMSIPDDLLEAAKIDGANEVQSFVRIVLPLARSSVVSMSIFTFITVWNDFLWPLVMITDGNMKTMTLAVAMLRNNYATNYGLMMAGSVLVFAPPFIVYCLLQKRFVESIAMSGIKA